MAGVQVGGFQLHIHQLLATENVVAFPRISGQEDKQSGIRGKGKRHMEDNNRRKYSKEFKQEGV
jgi:hypothetical protein